MKKLIAAIIILLPVTGSAVTLEQALSLAIDKNPTLHEQFARYQSKLELEDAAAADFYPQVAFRAAIGEEQTDYRSGQKLDRRLTRDELGLRITQSLFSGMETTANTDRLSAEAEAERWQLIASAENLALDVCEVYLETRKAESLMTLTERNVQDHLDIMNDVKRLSQSGHANEADVAQVSARLSNARSSLLAAQNNFQDQTAKFMRLTGTTPVHLTDPVVDSVLLPESLPDAMEWARDNHPQIQSAMSDIDAAKQEVRAAKANYFPRLSVEGIANKGHDIGGFEGPDEDYRIMLVMEYDLYNGGRDSSRAKASNWRYNEAMEIRRNAEEQLLEGTRFAWNAMQTLRGQEELLRNSVDASSLAESGYLTQFKLGRRSLLDLLNSKNEVFISRKNYLTAQYDLTQAAFRLLNASGRLSYALRIVYPLQWEKEDS